jgi:hypothetical protein
VTAAAVPIYCHYPAEFPAKFVLFHDAYPHIYDGIVERARELKRLGFTNVGVRYCFEHQRYSRDPRSPIDDGFAYALDNNFAAWYGRLIAAQERDLADFFRMRRTRGEIARPDPSQGVMEFD